MRVNRSGDHYQGEPLQGIKEFVKSGEMQPEGDV